MLRLAPCLRRHRVDRSGFTLLEMLIVLAILAALALWTWPTLRRQFRTSQLRDAGRQVRAELARARQKAVETGTIQYFRLQPGGRRFEVEPAPPLVEYPELPADLASDPTAQPEVEAERTEDGQGRGDRYELADGIYFSGIDWEPHRAESTASEEPLEADAAVAVDENSTLPAEPDAPTDEASWSPPIAFYPNGRTGDARIRLANTQNAYLDVTLRGLTGTATVGDVRHGKVRR